MSDFYTTRTANLRATRGDFSKIEAKKIILNGKNILDYLGDSEFNSYDARDPELKNDELDIWSTEIGLSEEGHIEVKPLEHTKDTISSTQSTTIKSAVKIIDNEALGTDDVHLMYWQTDGLTDGLEMFAGCSNLNSFSSDLSRLTNGDFMFSACTDLESFSSDLSSLTNGIGMFYMCGKLPSFSSDLSSLTNGLSMFRECSNLSSFFSDLSSLTNGAFMFPNCFNLTSFSSDLSSLTNGEFMFAGCSNLTSFTGDLSSLANGSNMFTGCKLDAKSFNTIIHTLPQRDEKPTMEEQNLGVGYITIGVGADNAEADQLLFAQECDCEDWQELLDEISAKNWIVDFQFNGRPTATYNMRRGETLPIYAKLEEAIMPTDENERKPRYAYTSADGSKFYNIYYFHSTNGSTEGYDVFSSLEEAISTYNVTPKN